jgi:hypothetical protein
MQAGVRSQEPEVRRKALRPLLIRDSLSHKTEFRRKCSRPILTPDF